MTPMTRPIRLASLVMAGVISLVLALLVAERVIRPGVIDEFGTLALLGLVMLFVLPAMTMLALRHDRREAVRLAGLVSGRAIAADARDDAHEAIAIDPSRLVRHAPHPRPPLPAAGRGAEGGGDRAAERAVRAESRV